MTSVAIVGAGISGLSCARALTAAGVPVTIFEKSRSLGGRCATRKWEGHIVDHGAQYFTIRDDNFRREMEELCGGDLQKIEAPLRDRTGTEIPARSPRWYHAQGNNRLGKCLLGEMPIRLEASVATPEMRDGSWWIEDAAFDAVVSSTPSPQTLAFLGRESTAESFAPCLTAFFSYSGDWAGNSASCYARVDPESPLAWSACENHKRGRTAVAQTVFVLQASPDFSATHFDTAPQEWPELLRAEFEAKWELPASARLARFAHRWRYARVLSRPNISELPRGFFVTGDVRTESRVESAWLAGRATAAEVLAQGVRL